MAIYTGIKRILIIVLLSISTFIGVQISVALVKINTTLIPSLLQVVANLNLSAADFRKITGDVQEYTALQLGVLRSNREQKAIQAGLEVAAALKGTVLVLNKSVLPRVNRELDTLTETTQSLNNLIIATDSRINSDSNGLIPQTTAVIKRAEFSLQTVQEATNEIGGDIHSLVSNKDFPEALASLADASKQLDLTVSHAEEAMRQAPIVMKHVETITGNSSKVSKMASWGSIGLIAAKIFSLVF